MYKMVATYGLANVVPNRRLLSHKYIAILTRSDMTRHEARSDRNAILRTSRSIIKSGGGTTKVPEDLSALTHHSDQVFREGVM